VIPRIREIHLRNYKSIGDAVVRLSDFNVLVGPNGSGKTNFMDALSFMRDCLRTSVNTASAAHRGIAFYYPPDSREGTRVGLRAVIDFGSSTADFGFELHPVNDEWVIVAERCVICDPSGVVNAYAVQQGSFETPVPGVRPVIEPDRLALSAVSALDEFRPVYEFLAGVRKYAIDPSQLRTLSTGNAASALLEDGRNAASVLAAIHQQDAQLKERVVRLLASVLPELVDVQSVPVGEQRALFFSERPLGQERMHFSASMSEGTLRMLGILLAVYQPATPTVLLIEEPEATIHPAATDVLMAVLLDAAHRSQVIISTHSPDVLDYKDLPDGSILVVSKEDGTTRITPLGAASRTVIQRRLSTPGELLRIDELNADEADPNASGPRDFLAPVSGVVGEAA